MLCMQLTYCIWRKSFVYVCKLFVCSGRVYQNRLKLVEIGQSNTAAIILLKTGMVFSLKLLSKWKLMNDFFCEILLVFCSLKENYLYFAFENYLYFKDCFPPRKSYWLLTLGALHKLTSVSVLISEKEGEEWKLRKQQKMIRR